MDGFFRITFTGTAGSGFGMLVLGDGVIVGVDAAGAMFDGSYTDNSSTQALDFRVTMSAPAGITPVQTGIAVTEPINFPISGSPPLENITSETQTLLETPLGPINLIFKSSAIFHNANMRSFLTARCASNKSLREFDRSKFFWYHDGNGEKPKSVWLSKTAK